jgi:hypothetical protein
LFFMWCQTPFDQNPCSFFFNPSQSYEWLCHPRWSLFYHQLLRDKKHVEQAGISRMITATELVIMQREVVDSDFMVDQFYFLWAHLSCGQLPMKLQSTSVILWTGVSYFVGDGLQYPTVLFLATVSRYLGLQIGFQILRLSLENKSHIDDNLPNQFCSFQYMQNQ